MPIDCHLSSETHARRGLDDATKLLRSTCPFHGMMEIRPRADHGVFRMSYRQPKPETDENPYLFLHCKVGVCSYKGGRQDEGIATVSALPSLEGNGGSVRRPTTARRTWSTPRQSRASLRPSNDHSSHSSAADP